jgi:hypothetical protein
MKEKLSTDHKKNDPIDTIPFKGSLGLLAYGDMGLRAWRDVKKQTLKK